MIDLSFIELGTRYSDYFRPVGLSFAYICIRIYMHFAAELISSHMKTLLQP